MKLAIISFTENGIKLSQTVARRLSGRKVTLYTKCSRYTAEDLKVQRVKESLQVWTAQRMAEGDALLFIGACGIAVRAYSTCFSICLFFTLSTMIFTASFSASFVQIGRAHV